MMQEFVHAQLMTILQPFVDQLELLSDALNALTAQTAEIEDEVLHHREQVAQNQSRLTALEARATEATTGIQEVHKKVSGLGNRTDVLLADHSQVKAAIAESEAQLAGASSQIQKLLGGQDGIIAQLDRLNNGVDHAEQKQLVVDKRLEHLHQFCKDLKGEQAMQQESIREAHMKSDRSSEAIRKTNAQASQKQGEDEEKFACLNQHARGFEAKLSHYLGTFREQDNMLKAHDKEFQRVAAEMAKIRSQEELYQQFSELFLQVREFNRRVVKLEDGFSQVNLRNGVDLSVFQDTVAKIHEQAEENSLKIASVDRSQANSSQQVDVLSKTLVHLEEAIQNFDHRATVIDGEVQDLHFWQHGATEKFEEHNTRLQSCKGDFQKCQKELNAKGIELNDLRQDISATQKRLSRIDGNVDIMQKYFTGFGKGLQDTSRCVSSRDTFNTPRTSPQRPHSATVSTGLPSLPVRSDSPTRQRPWSSIERTTRDIDDL